jgi:hypothetical protein
MNNNDESKNLKNPEMSIEELFFYENFYKHNRIECFIIFLRDNKVSVFDKPYKNYGQIHEFTTIEDNDNNKNFKNFHKNEIDRVVGILENGLKRLKDICISSKANFYSTPVAFYEICCDGFYCGIEELVNALANNYPVEINEELDFIKAGVDYTKVSIVYDLNESYVEVVNRILIDLNENLRKSENNESKFYVTQAFKINTRNDYEKLAGTLLEAGIDSEIFEMNINENLEESEKNIKEGIILLPYLYFVFLQR